MNEKPKIIAANYCISFIDLLGQSEEYKGQGLLPKFNNSAEEEQFYEKIRKTITPIYRMQEDASSFLNSALRGDNTIKTELPPELHDAFDHMGEVHLVQQRWSDGLVYFSSLMRGTVSCPVVSIFHMFGTVGSLCFLGLCKKSPLRGSVDISWAVELHPGEIYGAAVANAYCLESNIAQYPRIVIGERLIDYLHVNSLNPNEDVYSKLNKLLADICLSMIAIDFDGNGFLDYLGGPFKSNITKGLHSDLFQLAYQFINDQLELNYKKKDTKLSMRYNHLLAYFESYKGSIEQDNAQPL